ncbi:2-dehydropantoate 2-reductase [soil metagenome]
MTTVGIVGCGAIGSLFAAHLATVEGVTVWGFDVSAPHVAAMNANGLRITGAGELTARISARTDATQIPPCDFGIVATKSEYTAAAIASAAPFLRDAAVASVQNGVGNEELIAKRIGRVIRGSTLASGAILEPGVVRFDATGDTWLGPFEPNPASMAEVEQLAALITAGGMATHALADSRGAQWTKLIFNSANNALCAATGLSIGQLGDDSTLRALVSGIIREGTAVATALGIDLESDPETMFDDAVAHAWGHRPSMLQDVAARRHTEIAVLNGGIVAEARTVGVPTPLNETLVAVVQGIELSWA